MNEAEALDQLDAIIDGPGTKARKARALFRLGCDRSDVTELLGMSYSQAHSIYKRLQDGEEQEHHSDSGPEGGRRVLSLSPSQTRVATQDGHRVIKIDTGDRGTVCRECDRRLSFSIRWLAFVHASSQAEPTKLEDRYE